MLTEVRPALFISDYPSASSLVLLHSHGITHIINLCAERPCAHPSSFTYKHLRTSDTQAQQLSPFFGECVGFISAARDGGGRVLVHCAEGISRSATIVLAFLMVDEALVLSAAFKKLKAKRVEIEPNPAFLRQLRAWERQLGLGPPSMDKLTPLDDPAVGVEERAWENALRVLLSLSATMPDHSGAAPPSTHDFTTSFATTANSLRSESLQAAILLAFELYGSSTARDDAARGALARAVQALVNDGVVAEDQLREALRMLVDNPEWGAVCMDVPLATRFLRELRGALDTT